MSKTMLTFTILVAALALTCFGCQKGAQRHSMPWDGELAAMVTQDLTLKYWLTGKTNYGEWKNPLSPSVLKDMNAPEIKSIMVTETEKPSEWSHLVSAEVRITFKTSDGDYTVDSLYYMPIRGKNWFAVGDTDWKTGKIGFYDARDNYISVITSTVPVSKKDTPFQPVKPAQIDGIPQDAYKDLTYRWLNNNLVIRDSREKKEYRYIPPTKKGDPDGTMQVSPIR